MERSDSAGIELVHVVAAPPDTVRLDSPVVRIGSTGIGGEEHEVFELISDLALLPAGRIAVVDNRGARVAVFDSTGEWLRDVGGRGEGPGEYTGPIYASVRGDTLFVWDALLRRFSRYASDGEFIGATTMPERSSAHPFTAIEGGYVTEVESGQLRDPAPARGAVVRTDRDGERVDTVVGPYPVPERGWEITNEETGMGQMVNPPAFAIYPPWTVAERRVYWLDPEATTVEVRDLVGTDGPATDPTRIVRLPYEVSAPGEAEREAYFEAREAGVDAPDAVIARSRAQTEFAAQRPPVAGIVVDDDGRLWVAEHDPAARRGDHIGSGWDVVDFDGEQAVRVDFPTGFELKAVRDGRAYGITTLETGVHVVDVFRLPGTTALAAAPVE